MKFIFEIDTENKNDIGMLEWFLTLVKKEQKRKE